MFINRLTPAEEAALYSDAEEISKIFNRLTSDWWLSHGSLYGAYCCKGRLPWDDDLDIAFPRSKLDALLEVLRFSGWKWYRINSFVLKVWRPEAALYKTSWPWSWPFIDVALYDEFPLRKTIVVEHCQNTKFALFNVKDLIPTQLTDFGALKMPIPAYPEKYLDEIYPPWRERARSNGWDHRNERANKDPAVWLPNEKIKEIFPSFQVPEKPKANEAKPA